MTKTILCFLFRVKEAENYLKLKSKRRITSSFRFSLKCKKIKDVKTFGRDLQKKQKILKIHKTDYKKIVMYRIK